MLNRLIDLAVHRRLATMVLTIGFAIFGVITFSKLRIEAFPDVTNVQVMVISLYPGQAAEEVEKQGGRADSLENILRGRLGSKLAAAEKQKAKELLSWDLDHRQLCDIELLLNGAGIRSKLFIKVYVGALYVGRKSTAAAAIIAYSPDT